MHGRLNGIAVEIRHLFLSNLPNLLPGDFTDFFAVGLGRTLFYFSGFFEEFSSRGRFDNKVKALVLVNSDDDGKNLARLILRAGIELLTKLHDVHALRAEGGTYGWSRVSLATFDL